MANKVNFHCVFISTCKHIYERGLAELLRKVARIMGHMCAKRGRDFEGINGNVSFIVIVLKSIHCIF